jgi:HD superfamily phosphohydrolase
MKNSKDKQQPLDRRQKRSKISTKPNAQPLPDELEKLERKYGFRPNRVKAYKIELPTVVRYFTALQKHLAQNYQIDEVLAVGGTGIVFTGRHKRFFQAVAIKINRPGLRAEEGSMVAHEAELLPTLNHPNIVSVLDLGTLCDHDGIFCECGQQPDSCKHTTSQCNKAPKLTYIVEPYISGSKPFFTNNREEVEATWLYERVSAIKRDIPDVLESGHLDELNRAVERISLLLRDVTELFAQWVSLLSHVHESHDGAEAGYVYLDVKPVNVLVDLHLHLTSIDFGSAQRVDQSDDESLIVFFTEAYAHERLEKLKTEQASSNRVMGGIKRKDLEKSFDYYALGISMLEILEEVASIKPHLVPQLPLYRTLHFLAARLLDGLNSTRGRFDNAPEVFPGLSPDDYDTLRYLTLRETCRDLDKELGRWSLEGLIPELATYSKDIVRLVPGYNTVLTPRLRAVIEHPLVARLKYVTQLGLVSLVYPTADHSRYDHALGSYTYTTYYVKSLFNDPGNPLFRNVVGDEDIKAVLLAALLHDLGQYPLAHDLEEVHRDIFNHSLLGEKFLEDTTLDKKGRTLTDLIEDPQNGWGVSQDSLAEIRGARSRSRMQEEGANPTLPQPKEQEPGPLKTNVLAAIIDGQVDADKADYIIRDSTRCELPYGAQLDLERLLRVLTVAIIPGSGNPVRLGVYDKGLVSAHAFGQARYQLLATVYWHHTSRIIKAMLQYATAMGLPDIVFNSDPDKRDGKDIEIRERLLQFLKLMHPPFSLQVESISQPSKQAVDLLEKPSKRVEIKSTTKIGEPPDVQESTEWYPGISWTDWLMLRWIANLDDSTAQGRNLIHCLQQRKLYKRIATFERGIEHAELIGKLEDLQWPAKLRLCKQLHAETYKLIRAQWGSIDTTTITSDDFEELNKSHLMILIDVPMASKKIGHARPVGVVPELKEKSYSQGTRQAHEDNAWHDIMKDMIEGIAPVRVLCHPYIRNMVSTVWAPTRPKETLEQKLAREIRSRI